MNEDTIFYRGMELIDECGDTRYVMEDCDSEYIHLTGYDDTCMCEAWYTVEELVEQEYHLTGKVVDINTLDQNKFTIKCECDDTTE